MTTRPLTFGMIKPDITTSTALVDVLDAIKAAGFVIAASKAYAPASHVIEDFYEEHQARPYFGELVRAMRAGPVIALLLAAPGREPITAWRQFLGATDPSKAAPGTLRARFGTAGPRNAAHGSDSPEAVVREADFFFTHEEIVAAGELPVEIERKFLVAVTPEAIAAGATSEIRQGYIYTGDPEVRIRDENGTYTVTEKRGQGLARIELESPVTLSVGEALFSVAGPVILQKRRTRLGRWEIDRYLGKLSGLTVAEVELASADEPLPALPEGLSLLREVTEDSAFKNQSLARRSAREAEEFVVYVRRELARASGSTGTLG